MKQYLLRVLSVGILLAAGWTDTAKAADKGDVYLEPVIGSHLEDIRQLFSGAVVGYVPAQSVGLGLDIKQFFAMNERFKATEGTQVAFDFRWFLEPLEVSGQLGLFFPLAEEGQKAMLSGGVVYLLALTPALAARVGLDARYLFGEKTVLYATVGGRILF